MKYNSLGKYNSKYNYNGAPQVRVYSLYANDSWNLNDSFDYDDIYVVHETDSFLKFTDSAASSDVDFLIGTKSGLDESYDWFAPLPMKVDWSSTSLQVMPTSESEYIDMPNVDGSMVQNTTYKNRAFNFVLYSEDGLTDGEKTEIKQKIATLLDSTKGSFKKLSIPPSDHYFEVKYSGTASIQDGPSFVKATLPFEVKPYSHPLFSDSGIESGTITNHGLKPCGLRIVISSFWVGTIVNPSFTINGEEYSWRSTLSGLFGNTLVIDGEKMICYTSDKTNAIAYLYPQGRSAFVTIQPGESVTVAPSDNTKGHITFSINESYIW